MELHKRDLQVVPTLLLMQIWHLDPTSPASFTWAHSIIVEWHHSEFDETQQRHLVFDALSLIKKNFLNWIITLQNFVVFKSNLNVNQPPLLNLLPIFTPTPLGWCPLLSSSLGFRKLHTIYFLISSFCFKWTHLLGILQEELVTHIYKFYRICL